MCHKEEPRVELDETQCKRRVQVPLPTTKTNDGITYLVAKIIINNQVDLSDAVSASNAEWMTARVTQHLASLVVCSL